MGKRKANNDVLASPKKGKNDSFATMAVKEENTPQVKVEKHPSSDSEGEDYEDNGFDQAEETRHDGNQSTYDPDEMRVLAESFLAFLTTRNEKPSVHNMERQVADWAAEIRQADPIDTSLFVADFKKYLKNAIKLKNFPLSDALSVLISYVGGVKALSDFKTYPGTAPKRVHLYMKKKKMTTKVGAELATVSKMLREEDAAFLEELDQDFKNANEQYVLELQTFIDSHPNLADAQLQTIKRRITAIEKAARPKAPATPKTPRKLKKEPETAFSLFCRTKTDKYRDLSEEDREKKLLKKFGKLSSAELDLLESLALNSK